MRRILQDDQPWRLVTIADGNEAARNRQLPMTGSGQCSIGVKPVNLIEVKAGTRERGHRDAMPFYRFHVHDPINRLDGHGHDGAALDDDIDALLFAAGIVQRLVQEHPSVPRNWAINITQDARAVGILPFEAGLKVLLRPHWACDQPRESHQAWR